MDPARWRETCAESGVATSLSREFSRQRVPRLNGSVAVASWRRSGGQAAQIGLPYALGLSPPRPSSFH